MASRKSRTGLVALAPSHVGVLASREETAQRKLPAQLQPSWGDRFRRRLGGPGPSPCTALGSSSGPALRSPRPHRSPRRISAPCCSVKASCPTPAARAAVPLPPTSRLRLGALPVTLVAPAACPSSPPARTGPLRRSLRSLLMMRTRALEGQCRHADVLPAWGPHSWSSLALFHEPVPTSGHARVLSPPGPPAPAPRPPPGVRQLLTAPRRHNPVLAPPSPSSCSRVCRGDCRPRAGGGLGPPPGIPAPLPLPPPSLPGAASPVAAPRPWTAVPTEPGDLPSSQFTPRLSFLLVPTPSSGRASSPPRLAGREASEGKGTRSKTEAVLGNLQNPNLLVFHSSP